MVSVNNSTSGAEAHLPFGGNGKSGNGSRQSGIWVLDQFTRWQAMNWDYSGRLQKAQMDVADVDADLGFRLDRSPEAVRATRSVTVSVSVSRYPRFRPARPPGRSPAAPGPAPG